METRSQQLRRLRYEWNLSRKELADAVNEKYLNDMYTDEITSGKLFLWEWGFVIPQDQEDFAISDYFIRRANAARHKRTEDLPCPWRGPLIHSTVGCCEIKLNFIMRTIEWFRKITLIFR